MILGLSCRGLASCARPTSPLPAPRHPVHRSGRRLQVERIVEVNRTAMERFGYLPLER